MIIMIMAFCAMVPAARFFKTSTFDARSAVR